SVLTWPESELSSLCNVETWPCKVLTWLLNELSAAALPTTSAFCPFGTSHCYSARPAAFPDLSSTTDTYSAAPLRQPSHTTQQAPSRQRTTPFANASRSPFPIT